MHIPLNMARKLDIKGRGQVFTPCGLANEVLDLIPYTVSNAIGKHVIDNSCGDGAFLLEAVRRYCDAWRGDADGLKSDLETYIHGIDIDEEAVLCTCSALDGLTGYYGVHGVKWDVRCCDALNCDQFDGMMDCVIGNPPWVCARNLGDLAFGIKRFEFCKKGQSDLYLAFFEKGLAMLADGGVLAYVSPDSWTYSRAGTAMRRRFQSDGSIYAVAMFGEHDPFFDSVSVYPMVTCIRKGRRTDSIDLLRMSAVGRFVFKRRIPMTEAFASDRMILTDDADTGAWMSAVLSYPQMSDDVAVRNGFCTGADDVFRTSDQMDGSGTMAVCKASTGEWERFIMPYDQDGNLLGFEALPAAVRSHLSDSRDALIGRSMPEGAPWYSFSRSQGLHDFMSRRLAVSAYVSHDRVIVEEVDPGEGVYGGMYVVSRDLHEARRLILSREFRMYVMTLGKYRQGGFFTFSAPDLGRFLAYHMTGPGKGRI